MSSSASGRPGGGLEVFCRGGFRAIRGALADKRIAQQSLRRSTKSLHTWKAQFLQPCKQIIETTEQAAEIRRLKKEPARVSEECDTLKKATGR
jgi:hypothetical protein